MKKFIKESRNRLYNASRARLHACSRGTVSIVSAIGGRHDGTSVYIYPIVKIDENASVFFRLPELLPA